MLDACSPVAIIKRETMTSVFTTAAEDELLLDRSFEADEADMLTTPPLSTTTLDDLAGLTDLLPDLGRPQQHPQLLGSAAAAAAHPGASPSASAAPSGIHDLRLP